MNNLVYIIQWCNMNEGFATIVLSVLTLFVSILAIIISVRVSYFPYKKMLKIEVGSYFTTDNESGLHVTAINCGNMDFTIKQMGFYVDKGQLMINTRSKNHYPIRLRNGEQVSEYFNDNADAIQTLKEHPKVIAYVKDSEGKLYKKRMRCK